MKELLMKFARMDRRFVFLGVGFFTVIPLLFPWNLPINVGDEVQTVFDEIDQCGPDANPVLLSFDFDPGTMAELGPMAKAVLRHIFSRKGKVIVLTFMPTGRGLAQKTLFEVAKEYGAVYGKDFVFLGYFFPPSAAMLGIGENIRTPFPRDYEQTKLDDLPMMRTVKNYKDILIVMDLAGNSMPESWITMAWGRYGANFTMGVTAVMAPDYKPFLLAGQSKGMLGGMRGGAEYEKILVNERIMERKGVAMLAMDPQSAVHLFMITIIVLGNIAYFLSRKK